MTKIVTMVGTFMLALAAVLFVPKAMAQETVTITLTADECVQYTNIVYFYNKSVQTGGDPDIFFPITQLPAQQHRLFVRWIKWLASGTGRGLSPLTHAQAFLSVCSQKPVGELTIPAFKLN